MKTKLKELIDKKDLKSGRIALKLGFSQSEMSAYINGRRYPQAKRMKKIADYLGVKIEDIFF